MKKRVIAFVMSLTIMLSLVSCGEKKSEPESGGAKIKVITWDAPASGDPENEKERFRLMRERLAVELPHIELVDLSRKTGADYYLEYDKSLMAGEAPSYTAFAYPLIPTRIKNGTIADITEFVENWDLKKEDKIITQFDEAITSDNKWYAIPQSMYIQATLYNKKAIASSGYNLEKLPETWEEFVDVCKEVTDLSVPRIGYALMGMDWCAWPFTAWVWSAGGEMVRPNGDGTYNLAFVEDPAIEAAMFLNRLIWKERVTQKDVLQDLADLGQDVKSGRSCFSWSSPNVFTPADYKAYELTADDLGTMPMPVKDKSITPPSLSGGNVFVFNPKATKEELKAAWEVVTYLNFDENELKKQWEFDNSTGYFNYLIPGRKDLLETVFDMHTFVPERIKEEFFAMVPNAIAEPYCPNWGELKSALANPLQKIFLSEDLTEDQARAILEECAESLYKQYPNSFKK